MKNSSKKKELHYKALLIIEEQLNQEILLYKKYLHYANMCFDSELKNICYKGSEKHKQNYNRLLSYLES